MLEEEELARLSPGFFFLSFFMMVKAGRIYLVWTKRGKNTSRARRKREYKSLSRAKVS